MQTIADRVGVTKMTVSNVFSHPDRVEESLRDRILLAADQLGYGGPDASARALARGRTGTVGVMLTDQPASAFEDEVALGLVAGIARALSQRSLSLVLLANQSTAEFVPARDVAMDAVITYACTRDGDGLRWLLKRRLPVVTLDDYDLGPTAGVDAVNVDDRGGARAAAEHLGALGHRRIAGLLPWVDAPRGVATREPASLAPAKQGERWIGWCEGLAPWGVVPTVFGRAVELDRSGAARLAYALFDGPVRPTAVLCWSDEAAAGVLDAAAEWGLGVPADVSVVGFDDSPMAAVTVPPLTTVRQDLTRKAEAAVDLLYQALDEGVQVASRKPRRVVLPTELVLRASTGPAPVTA